MPSAASVKLEKPPTNNSANNNVATIAATMAELVDNNSPIRQVLVIIDHKIRNLEKRKSKLESYRDIEKSGKDLSADQKVAVSKYDEVAMTLDFAREFSKQIMQIATASEKDLKKKQKKDETSKKQGETSKIREVLMIQDVLAQLSIEEVRKDFLAGSNGACKLEQADLDLLDLFHSKVKPKRPTEPGGLPFKAAAQKSADHLTSTIDGKQKEFEDSTYGNVKTIIKNIQKCAYFDKTTQPPLPVPPSTDEAATDNAVVDEEKTEVEQAPKEIEGPDAVKATETAAPVKEAAETSSDSNKHEFQEAPSANAVPVPSFPPQHPLNPVAGSITTGPQKAQPNLQTLPQLVPQQNILAPTGQPGTIQLQPVPPGHPLHVQPTTVRAVEQAYFKQHQYIQQMRPLAEVLGAGNFYFLQESELDSPEVIANANAVPPTAPQQQPQPLPPQLQQTSQPPLQQQPTMHQTSPQSQIVTQTFTNQAFPNVVYGNMKPPTSGDVSGTQPQQMQQQQPHIPGFATANTPIPIPMVQQAPIPVATTIPQQSNSKSNAALHTPPPQSIGAFPPAGKFIPPSRNSAPQSKIAADNSKDHRSNATLSKNKSETIPEITDWKPEDSGRTSLPSKPKHSVHHSKEIDDNSNEWRDPYNVPGTNTESGEWNPVTNGTSQEESNTWPSGNSSNPRYQYRQGPGGYRNGPRPSGPGRNNSVGPGVGSTNSTTNGYRGRQNSSYQSNTGRSNGGNSGSNSGTFYRNNDPTYYQNGSRGGGGEKSDSYNRTGNYRPRDTNTTSGSSFKSGQPMPQRNPNQTISSTANRDNDNRGGGHNNNNSINNNNQNQSHRSANTNNNNNPTTRGINAPNKHHAGGNSASSSSYGRPPAAGGVRSQPQQTINA